jgi:hypothetical protein
MTTLGRSIVESTGYIGGPGYNVIHWSAGAGAGPTSTGGVEEFHDTLQASFTALAPYLIEVVEFTILPQVDCFSDSDGVIFASTTDPTSGRVVVGEAEGRTLDRAACVTTRFRTEEYVNGRRLQGRAFIGPVGVSAFNTLGQIDAGVQTDVEDALAGLITGLGGRLAVWHRPTTPSGTDGSYGDVTSIQANQMPGTLRSRKS